MPLPFRQPAHRLLVVESDGAMSTFVSRVLGKLGYEIVHVGSAELALLRLAEGGWDALLTDVHLPGMSGLDLLAAVRRAHPGLRVVVMTADGSETVPSELAGCGADEVLTKPLTPVDLVERMQRLLGDPGTAAR